MKRIVKLLAKELRLALHPTNMIFWMLSAMLLIPNYPYYVTFFYTTLGLFFVCLTGRENHDIEYSLLLPLRKKDAVTGRFALAVFVEAVQLLVAVPFAFLRQRMLPAGNAVGMDANIALFGLVLVMMGVFNLQFFISYYRNPAKVGKAFAVGSILSFLFIVVAECLTHAVPFFRDQLDTPDPQFLCAKLLTLGAGVVLFALLTGLAYRISVRRFEALDL